MSNDDARSGLEQTVRNFLQQGVPPGGTPRWREWKENCRQLGPKSAPALLDALENGSEIEQYAALLGLRLFGYEAFGDGHGADLIYEILDPGGTEKRVIKPKITSST